MSKPKDKEPSTSLEDCLADFAKANEDVVREALSSNRDLRLFSDKVKKELTTAHREAVEGCIRNAEQLTDLYNQINSCDQVFERLEKTLIGFQNDLGTVSDDMKRLQDQSVLIKQELENRQKVRNDLSQFVDDIVVPQAMIKVIMESDVSDRQFLEQLHELQHKLHFIRAQEFKEARAVEDVQPVLESLKYKAIEKIREWTLTKIYMFRKPLSNYQVPQHQLLKYRFFYEFLLANERNIAKEIQAEYVDTIGKMFFSYFKMPDAASKDDLLGVEDTVKHTGLTGLFSSKPSVRNRATVFSLGSRQNLLTHDFISPLIVPHAAKELNQKFQFETIFRSVHLALVDHSSHEFLFVADFFLFSGQAAINFHSKVMARAVEHLLKEFEQRIAFNFDAISLYLCIRLCDKFRNLLIEREIPPMDEYWETICNQLWVRFDAVMKMHNDSVNALDVRKMQTPIDTRPHYIIRRYAELTCALLVVSECSGKELGKKIEAILESSEDAIEQLLLRMSGTLSLQKDKLVFLINNYDLILSIIDERVVQDNRIHSIIHELEQKAIGEFVEVTLSPHFASLFAFVTECEPLVNQGHTQMLTRYNDKLTQIVGSFNTTWKKSIDLVNAEIIKSFTNFKNGTNILQAAFSQLIQYVQRFTKIISHEAFRDNASRNEMINIHHIMVEIKKYKPVY